MCKVVSFDLRKLMPFIAAMYPFTAKKYPELKRADGVRKLTFAVRHSALHIMKTAGKIASEAEGVDHGGLLNQEKLREAAVKMTINALNLANVIGMSPDELIRGIHKEFSQHT